MTRKAERLVNLVAALLNTARPLTPQELKDTIPGYGQENWDSFLRMFERDKEDLREVGVPLELAPVDAWEAEEGYRIPKERYYLPDLELEADEIASLWMAAGLLKLSDTTPVRNAMLKLAGDVPPSDLEPSLVWLAADLSLDQRGVSRAFEAVAERRVVTFTYKSRGSRKQRVVEPYGLVFRKGVWYLAGRDRESENIRSFRLDNIQGELRLLSPSGPGGEYQIPLEFRAEAVLEIPPFAQGEGMTARVEFDAATAWRVARENPWIALEWANDGRAEAKVEVAEPKGFLSWILSFGSGASVVEPEELRLLIREHLESLCA